MCCKHIISLEPSFTIVLVLQTYLKKNQPIQYWCPLLHFIAYGCNGHWPMFLQSISDANILVIPVVPAITDVSAFQSFQLSSRSCFPAAPFISASGYVVVLPGKANMTYILLVLGTVAYDVYLLDGTKRKRN
jgi:hypothetical protein